MTRTDVGDVRPVDRRKKLSHGIELRFRLAPVVLRAPVAHQALRLRQLNALRLVGDGLSVEPPRGGDASAKVDERVFRDIDAEGTDGAAGGDLHLRHDRRRWAGGLRVAGGGEQE